MPAKPKPKPAWKRRRNLALLLERPGLAKRLGRNAQGIAKLWELLGTPTGPLTDVRQLVHETKLPESLVTQILADQRGVRRGDGKPAYPEAEAWHLAGELRMWLRMQRRAEQRKARLARQRQRKQLELERKKRQKLLKKERRRARLKKASKVRQANLSACRQIIFRYLKKTYAQDAWRVVERKKVTPAMLEKIFRQARGRWETLYSLLAELPNYRG